MRFPCGAATSCHTLARIMFSSSKGENMLVLEATKNRQGERPGDYHWCNDGELAYRPGIDCNRLDCGCERGWAGFDSHSATTTVEVVDRADLTVDKLASELAVSLFEGGWITTPNASDELVTLFVEEIVDLANEFGEGAVLERDGEWTQVRDDVTRPINPFDRVGLEQLTEGISEYRPMDLMGYATSLLHSAGHLAHTLISTLVDADWPEAQTLGCALEWLTLGEATHGWENIPGWLHRLNRANISQARRRRSDEGDAYLIAIEVDGDEIGLASIFVRPDGRIDSFFGVPDQLHTFIQLTKTLQREHFTPYRKIALSTAKQALLEGRSRSDKNSPPSGPGAWPANRPLLDLIVDTMAWCV